MAPAPREGEVTAPGSEAREAPAPRLLGLGKTPARQSGFKACRAGDSRVNTAIFMRRLPPGNLHSVGDEISLIARLAAWGRVGSVSQGRRRLPASRQGGPGSEPSGLHLTSPGASGQVTPKLPDSYLPQPHLSTRLLKRRCGCPPAWAWLPCLWGYLGLMVTHQGTRAPASRRPLCFSLRNVGCPVGNEARLRAQVLSTFPPSGLRHKGGAAYGCLSLGRALGAMPAPRSRGQGELLSLHYPPREGRTGSCHVICNPRPALTSI